MIAVNDATFGWVNDATIATHPDGYDTTFAVTVQHHNGAPDDHTVVIGGDEDSDDGYGDTWHFDTFGARALAQSLIRAADLADELNASS